MSKNLLDAEKWLMGNAFINSTISENIEFLCDTIGSRWSGSKNETVAVNFIIKTLSAQCSSNETFGIVCNSKNP